MARLRFPTIRVELDDGTELGPFRTTALDAKLYESTAQRHAWPELGRNVTTYLLFLAYSAAKRSPTPPAGTLDEWSEHVVAIEHDLDDEDDDAGSGVDPTLPDRSTDSRSSSP